MSSKADNKSSSSEPLDARNWSKRFFPAKGTAALFRKESFLSLIKFYEVLSYVFEIAMETRWRSKSLLEFSLMPLGEAVSSCEEGKEHRCGQSVAAPVVNVPVHSAGKTRSAAAVSCSSCPQEPPMIFTVPPIGQNGLAQLRKLAHRQPLGAHNERGRVDMHLINLIYDVRVHTQIIRLRLQWRRRVSTGCDLGSMKSPKEHPYRLGGFALLWDPGFPMTD